MSYKFEHKGRKFWAKEFSDHVEVYFLEVKGLSEKIFHIDGKCSTSEQVKERVAGSNIERARTLLG
jgi:hypothetical protein